MNIIRAKHALTREPIVVFQHDLGQSADKPPGVVQTVFVFDKTVVMIEFFMGIGVKPEDRLKHDAAFLRQHCGVDITTNELLWPPVLTIEAAEDDAPARA